MINFNSVTLMGNLTKDPIYQKLQNGNTVCNLNLAANKRYKNKKGEMSEEICFIDVDCWGAQADNCNQYLSKGDRILIHGSLKMDSWQNDKGQKITKHKVTADTVTFLSSTKKQDQQNNILDS